MSGSTKRRRTAELSIRLLPEERAQIDALAARAGLTPGCYVRLLVLASPAPRQARRASVDRQSVARCLGTLGLVATKLRERVPEAAADFEPDLNVARDLLTRALGRRDDH